MTSEVLGLRICPFNENHVMPSSSYQRHILRCKRNYNGTKVPCPYNASEYIAPDLLAEHLTSCKFRPEYNFGCTTHKCANFTNTPFFTEGPPCDEDWGTDPSPL